MLHERAALVTGGASGIGAATAVRFAAAGARVILADIDDAGGAAVVEEIRCTGGIAHYLHVDVTDRAAVREMVRRAEVLAGPLGVLFNNAMTSPSDSYTEDERWDLMIESGLSAYWAAAVTAGEAMAAAGSGGSIVNNASIAGARLGIDFASEGYSAAKAGVVGLTRKLAKRFGPAGVRVNCICPGIIETPRWRGPAMTEPEFARRYRLMAPLGRFGTADEVAALVTFLASDEAGFLTAQDIAIDGGFTLAPRFEAVDFALGDSMSDGATDGASDRSDGLPVGAGRPGP
jgi:NAD(P)-dependent dehydrogenase (short-subunit alcohol dehydrogenase family)